MTEPISDHDRLDVYRLSIEYVPCAFEMSKSLAGVSESSVEYDAAIEYEYEHEYRDAEHEHEWPDSPKSDKTTTNKHGKTRIRK